MAHDKSRGARISILASAAAVALAVTACAPRTSPTPVAPPESTPSSAPTEGQGVLTSLASDFVRTKLGNATSIPVNIVDLKTALKVADAPPADATKLALERRFAVAIPGLVPLKDELGWLPIEADGVVSDAISPSGIEGNLYLRGPMGTGPLPAGVTELGDGIWTAGEGDDNSILSPPPTPKLSMLGKPVRMAQRDGGIFFSHSTDDVRAWLDRRQAATEDSAFAAVIAQFDRLGAFSVVVSPAEDPLAPFRESVKPGREERLREANERVLIREGCTTIGVGYAADGDDIASYVVYAFPGAESAERALPTVIKAWTEGTDANGEDVKELAEYKAAERVDNLVVVTLDAGNSGAVLARMINTAPIACAVAAS